MKSKGIKYEFTAKPWQYTDCRLAFCFTPKEFAKEIKKLSNLKLEAARRLKAIAKLVA
jgi:hypothetical protein